MEQIAGLCDTWNVCSICFYIKCDCWFFFRFHCVEILCELFAWSKTTIRPHTFSLNCHNVISINDILRHIFVYVWRFLCIWNFRRICKERIRIVFAIRFNGNRYFGYVRREKKAIFDSYQFQRFRVISYQFVRRIMPWFVSRFVPRFVPRFVQNALYEHATQIKSNWISEALCFP